MKPEILVQAFEDGRGFTRDLADQDVLTLLSRLATEYLVRMDGSSEARITLAEALSLGIDVGRQVLDARREALFGATE